MAKFIVNERPDESAPITFAVVVVELPPPPPPPLELPPPHPAVARTNANATSAMAVPERRSRPLALSRTIPAIVRKSERAVGISARWPLNIPGRLVGVSSAALFVHVTVVELLAVPPPTATGVGEALQETPEGKAEKLMAMLSLGKLLTALTVTVIVAEPPALGNVSAGDVDDR